MLFRSLGRERQARGPVVYADYSKRRRHHPVEQRSLFQVGDAIETGSDPISRGQHGASNLSLNGIDVIHQPWRADDAYEEDEASRSDDDPAAPPAATRLVAPLSSTAVLMLHRFIQMNRTSKPHK